MQLFFFSRVKNSFPVAPKIQEIPPGTIINTGTEFSFLKNNQKWQIIILYAQI
jgi:hypothetical protein